MHSAKPNRYLLMLQKLISDYSKGYQVKVYLFGSRAKGKVHQASDVDIAILPLGSLPKDFFSVLKEKIEESAIPYKVDVIDLSQVDKKFREKILAEGIEWKGSKKD